MYKISEEIPKYFYPCPCCGILQGALSKPSSEDEKICHSCKEEMENGGGPDDS